MPALQAVSGRNILTGRAIEIRFFDRIEAVEPLLAVRDPELWLAPGFIDLQVNGFGGVDYNAASLTPEDFEYSLRALHRTGVTRFFPTVITASPDCMLQCLRNLTVAAAQVFGGESVAGFHVEGPHIASEDGPRGAHPAQWVRPPDLDEYARWQDATNSQIRLVTISPHWPGAISYIERLARDGVTASIGHTSATGTQIDDVIPAGATMSTHLGNGAHRMLPKFPNYLMRQLAEDRLTAGFIADGIHLNQDFLKVGLRAKGIGRSVLVTDASAPAGATPGRYTLGEQAVESTADGRVLLAGTDRLAGSALQMHRGVEILMRSGGLPADDAFRMATLNPARIAGIKGREQGLEVGDWADLIVFRLVAGTIQIAQTYLAGRTSFSEP